MNRKVFITVLILSIIYLVAFNVLKYVFPETFVLCLTGTEFITAGQFIDSRPVLYWICSVLFSGVTMYLYTCSCAGRKYLNLYETLCVVAGAILLQVSTVYFGMFNTHTSICIMLFLALICKGKLLNTVITFAIHGYLQLSILLVRGYEVILPVMNSAINLVFILETWFWLLTIYCIFNLREKNKHE